MKGGHNKKSTKQLELAGTTRKDRHGTTDEQVEFDEGMPHMPPNLADTAKQVWNRTVKELKAAGQLRKAYEAPLAGFAALYGEFLDDPANFPANRHTQMRMYITELGLGPVAKTRLAGVTPKGGESTDFDGF